MCVGVVVQVGAKRGQPLLRAPLHGTYCPVFFFFTPRDLQLASGEQSLLAVVAEGEGGMERG